MTTIRRAVEADVPEMFRVDSRAFGFHVSDAFVATNRPLIEVDRFWLVEDEAELIGMAGAYSKRLSLPGAAPIAVPGVTWVSIATTHRRRGLLTQLMRRQLDEEAERGHVAAVLQASEAAIYERFGYGVASHRRDLELDRRQVRLRNGVGDEGSVRFVSSDAERTELRRVFDAFHDSTPGCIDRSDASWHVRLSDPEAIRDSKGPAHLAMYRPSPGGAAEGYVHYRLSEKWERGLGAGTADVFDFIATTTRARAGLFRFLLGLDLIGTLSIFPTPVVNPLEWLVEDRRRLQGTAIFDDLWIRLLDIPAALSSRRYPIEDNIVIEVIDAFRPSSGGRFRLDVGPDGASCNRSTAAADISLDVSSLGAVFLGGVRLTTLAAAGRIDEHRHGAITRACTAFSWPTPPFNATSF